MADAAADGILDMVNSHRVSGAEGALESALVKYPTHKGLQVAEALILLKLGNLDAATRKANALVECDLAPRYSETLIYVLKKCCSWEPLITMYKKALTRVKNPMETQENMFHAYIRMEKYSDAQALATQLHQSFPSPQYIMWRVQCMLAQVPDGSKDNILLKLATKMLDSALADERMRRPAAVRTYIDVLVQQELFTEALKVLCSSLGSSVGLLMTRLELATTILRKLGHTALANAVAKANWKRNPDNWVPFTAYMETLDASNIDAAASAEMCSISLESNVAELRAVVDIATADASLEAAVQLATELQEAELRDRPRKLNRGPFMAELALLEKLGDEKKLNHAVMLYVQRFYRCPTCYLDVSTFLTADGAGEVHAWASCEDTQADGGEVGRHVQRILGLRCLVASWGITAATQPTEAEMSATMDECIRRYHESAHLSKNLEWSEEGLCDGYISVALNIALRGYVASPENRRLMWVSRGLELLHKVSRLLNNPTWLYFSICFANVMRLADTVAFGQLSFRSMQMDTMTHVGYWPIIGGLALDEVNVWEHEAMERRRQLEEDVSSIRSKIFTYFSWPAMAGLNAFIFKQRNSFALVLSDATYCLKELRECQSQKSILGVMAIKGRTLATVVEKLQQTTLVDNTDWATTRALILGNIHSEEVSKLAEKAVGVPSMDFRREYGLRLAYSLLLLHDLAALVGHQHALKQAPKPSKKNKMAAETSIPPPTLHLPALLQSSTPPVFFGSVRTMADSLIPLITKDTSVTSASNTAQLGQQLMELASRTDSHGLETFLFPESILVMSILTVCTALCAPLVKQWCAGTTEAMELATAKVSSDEWPTTGMSAEELQSAPRTQSLRQAKRKSMQHLLENFSRTTAALMRLK